MAPLHIEPSKYLVKRCARIRSNIPKRSQCEQTKTKKHTFRTPKKKKRVHVKVSH